jgi:hypothetical protein
MQVNSPYRQSAPTEREEDTVHVTNVAFWVLARQKYGWRFMEASHIGSDFKQMVLTFERCSEN